MQIPLDKALGYQRTNLNHSIYSKNGYFKIENESWHKVQTHLISNKNNRKYFTGKLYLPTKLFDYELYKDKCYDLIKLNHPIRIRDCGHMGSGYLLFIHNTQPFSNMQITCNAVNKYFNFKSCSKKFMIHKRKSKDITYNSLKIFLPKILIGYQIKFYQFLPSINIGIAYEKKDGKKEKKYLVGTCFMIFYENTSIQTKNIISNLKKSYKRKYELIIDLLEKRLTTKKIAEDYIISEDAVWKNIALAYKHKYIDRSKLGEVIKENSGQTVKDNLFIDLEKLRSEVKRDYYKILYQSRSLRDRELKLRNAFLDLLTVSNIMDRYEKKYQVKLIYNQVNCIIYFYKGLFE